MTERNVATDGRRGKPESLEKSQCDVAVREYVAVDVAREGVFPADAVLITDFVGVSSASGQQVGFGV